MNYRQMWDYNTFRKKMYLWDLGLGKKFLDLTPKA